MLGKNITTQHYIINYIFYLQTIYSYPAHKIQNTFKIFGGNFFVYSKQHSDTLNCQLSLSKQQLNESSHYCLAHSNSSHWCEHFSRRVLDWKTSKLQNSEEKLKMIRSGCFLVQNPDAFNSWSLKLPQEAAQTQFIYLSVVSYLFIQLFKTEMIANGQKLKLVIGLMV